MVLDGFTKYLCPDLSHPPPPNLMDLYIIDDSVLGDRVRLLECDEFCTLSNYISLEFRGPFATKAVRLSGLRV